MSQSEEDVLQVAEEVGRVDVPVAPGAQAHQDALLEGLGLEPALHGVQRRVHVAQHVHQPPLQPVLVSFQKKQKRRKFQSTTDEETVSGTELRSSVRSTVSDEKEKPRNGWR